MRRLGPLLLLVVVLTGGWLALRPGQGGPGDPARAPVSAPTTTPTGTQSSSTPQSPATTPTVRVTKTISGPPRLPAPAPSPAGRPLSPQAAARGFLATWNTWSWKDTTVTLTARTAPFVTPAFQRQLRGRDLATQWPIEHRGALERRGQRTATVSQLVANPDAPNDAGNRYYQATIDTVLLDSRGAVMVQRTIHASVWVVRAGPGWKVTSDQNAG